jgi:hypothetical protein
MVFQTGYRRSSLRLPRKNPNVPRYKKKSLICFPQRKLCVSYTRKTTNSSNNNNNNNNLYFMFLVLYFCCFIFALMAEQQYGASCKNGAFFRSITLFYIRLLSPRGEWAWGQDSSVDMTTRYGLLGPGIESRWGRDFPHPFGTVLWPTQPPIQWAPGLSRGQSGRGVALTIHPI